jgi:hypothetical protein
MATTIFKNGVRREVKNLGWLLRHRHEVAYIGIRPLGEGRATMVVDTYDRASVLTIYRTEWADISVCRDWLKARKDLWANTRFYDENGEVTA